MAPAAFVRHVRVPSLRRSLHTGSSLRREAIMMPAMSPFMTEGTVARWNKKEGEAFSAGDVLLQVASDFDVVDVQAEIPGIMGEILVPDGSTRVPVEKVLALVAKDAQEFEEMRARARPKFDSRPSMSPRSSTSPSSSSSSSPSSGRLLHLEPSLLHPAAVHRSGSISQHNRTDDHHHNRGMVMHHHGQTPLVSSDAGVDLRRKIVSSLSAVGHQRKLSMSSSATTEYFNGLI